MLAFLAPLRLVPARFWLWGGAVALILAAALWLYLAGRGDERAHQADRQAKLEAKAAAGREKAAVERLNDTLTINARERERHDATASLPDTRPSDRRIARACVQLRQQQTPERELPAVCRSGG
jgi:hypothetical protein